MKHTQEEKQAYFQQLRNRWKESKAMADNDEEAKALHREHAGKISYWSFYFVLQDMRANGFDGLPYIDCKTFNGWKDTGYKVRKGENSKISGIVWMHPKNKDAEGEESEDDSFIYPKVYHLFHKSQVEAL